MTVPEPRDPQAEEAPPEPPAITEAWGLLHAWSCGQRQDWDAPAVKLAMREAKNRGAGYREAAVILWRLAWDLAAGTRHVLGELSWLNRTGTPGTGESEAEVLAAIRRGDYERARRLAGTASVVPAAPGHGTAPQAETEQQTSN